MEPTMQELRLFLVRETTRQWREIDERFLEMRLAGLVEGPMNEFGAGRWVDLCVLYIFRCVCLPSSV